MKNSLCQNLLTKKPIVILSTKLLHICSFGQEQFQQVVLFCIIVVKQVSEDFSISFMIAQGTEMYKLIVNISLGQLQRLTTLIQIKESWTRIC